MKFASLAMAFVVLALNGEPAVAERIYTYWKLEPVKQALPTQAVLGEPFFEQSLVPIGLIKLDADAVPGNGKQAVPIATRLYLVFNKEGKHGYCTVKNWSMKNQAKTLFIPAADQRPCFVDSDEDGRFDKVFWVWDMPGGPPTARGSINSAQPMPPVPYSRADEHEYPLKAKLKYILDGKDDIARVKLAIEMDWDGSGVWQEKNSVESGGDRTFHALDIDVNLKSMAGKIAEIDVQKIPNLYIYRTTPPGIATNPLPAFLRLKVN